MSEILAENLSGKAVMGADGAELGMLYNITMDIKSGELHDLVITPNDDISVADLGFELDDEDRLRMPVNRVQAVKDYIVVKR
ncbi:MAG: PRC-barrel domain-containing protein [Euryarchaeota archaeon]|jgi:sporulation protein YlmC with PRC-barrel domain|nr:PRC-barrel domain-containing protein [Euryarchaeota archaeon]